jgi:predicted transcriptional regulator
MTILEAQKAIEADIVEGTERDGVEILSACGADLMSDVMAFVKDQVLLLTGLLNVQVIRTAILMDIQAICFVRGKTPSQEMIDMARENGIVLLRTKLPLFIACGKLYEAGVRQGGVRKID